LKETFIGKEAGMNKKYIVELTSQERIQLRDVINAKRMAAHKRRHARESKGCGLLCRKASIVCLF
jgi:hypothetical protein